MIRRRKCAVSSSSEDTESDHEKPDVKKKAETVLDGKKSTKFLELPASNNKTSLDGKHEIKKSGVSATAEGLIG